MEKLSPLRMAHAYALMAWNGKEYAEAMEMARTLSLQELNAITYAEDSFYAAKAGIEKHLFNGQKLEDKYFTGEEQAPEGYFDALGNNLAQKFDEESFGEGIMKILTDIHDTWVRNNAKKYDRDANAENPKNVDKRLYQHLPTQLIGVREVAKDLMFLAPILDAMGINTGRMQKQPYGEFVPSTAISDAYSKFSFAFIYDENNHLDKDNLKETLANVILAYPALQGESEMDTKRLLYMLDRTKLLEKQVVKNLDLISDHENEHVM